MLNKFWDFLTIGVPFDGFTSDGKVSLIIMGIVYALTQAIIACFAVDRRSSLGYSDLKDIRKSFYFYAVVFPLLFLAHFLEIILMIMVSSNEFLFGTVCILILISIIVKIIASLEEECFSLYHLSRSIQSGAFKVIVQKGYRYPLQSIFLPLIYGHRIAKKQRKYL